MTHKLLIDEANGIIKLDDLDIMTATNINVKIDDFNVESTVTLTFLADVTIIPSSDSRSN